MKALVGYTGFVGSNIYAEGNFDAVYNSKNIKEAYGTNPDLLIYAGLPAEKYLANNEPEKDMEQILQAEKNIAYINPKKLVLISTIDVFKNPRDVDETSRIDTENLHAYGYNRYQLEIWTRENYPDALIVRLPGLFGINLKKNFIYDLVNFIPFMLKAEKMDELVLCDVELKRYYELQNNGFYKLKDIDKFEKIILKQKFKALGFSALNFTDSRSTYQFYPLKRLWGDIQTALDHGIILWHPATEPIQAGYLYRELYREEFQNVLAGEPACYDYKTIYDLVFGGRDGYICDKNSILKEIKSYVENENHK